MNKNIKPKVPRLARSKRGHQDLQNEFLKRTKLDVSQGLTGVLHQVSQAIFCSSNTAKSRDICLAYINNAVNYICKISVQSESKDVNTLITVTKRDDTSTHSSCYKNRFVEDWSDVIAKEKYFCLFRCALLHSRKEVRIAILRLLRYILKTEEDVKCLIKSNSIPLLVRCMDVSLDNLNERLYGVRLARHLLQVSPSEFSPSLARCLIAIARDGAKERDKLLRSAQAIISELAILNTELFITCGGVSSTLHGILECPLVRVNEALIGSILFLLNDPKCRPACSQFHMIMAPFTDINYNQLIHELDPNIREELGIRMQSSCLAILTAMRSWPGLINFYQPKDQSLKTLIELLKLPNDSPRHAILDFLYDLLRIPIGRSHDTFDEALRERVTLRPLDPDAWMLNEGFVVAEAKAVLTHIAKFRPNLIQNYLSLILYTLIDKELLPALCHVIVTSPSSLSVKATLLLGEILHQADQNLPDCGLMSHSLPVLFEKASSEDGEQRLRASQAITALLQLSRIRQSQSPPAYGMSLYLRYILNANKEEGTGPRVISSQSDPAKISKWLGKDHDELIQQTLRDARVFSKPSSEDWQWHLLISVLRWPSASLLALEDTTYRSFVKKLLIHFKPSSKLFSKLDATHPSAQSQAEALVLFLQFLLNLSCEDQDKYVNDILSDINAALLKVNCEMAFHSFFSPSHLNISVCQYYFLAVGRLGRSYKGYEFVHNAGIYDQMMAVIDHSVSDIYAKLFASTLDYSIDGLNRKILSKILTSAKECSRMYATQLLRVFVHARLRDFTRWGMDLLVGQLCDKSKLVALAALDVLDEAMDDEEYLESVLKNPPSVQYLGDNGQLLLAKFVSSPQGFRTYHDCNFIVPLLDKWANTFNLKYVKLMQMALAESLTQLQRGEDGLFGRRTGNKHVVHDVFVLPHLFGSLTLHKEGFSMLMQHSSVANLIHIINQKDTSDLPQIFKLKSAIWALGHLGRSASGVAFLASEDVISQLVTMAANCPVYSVRGTVFHALCLMATTAEGVFALQKYGWESVRRHHHEQLQLHISPDGACRRETLSRRSGNQFSESDADDPEIKVGFPILDESEDESLLLMDELDADLATTRKSQTLPHDSRPPSYFGHQRSLSDCPVLEELAGGVPHPGCQETGLANRGNRIKNILSSFRRKSKRRDSVGSRTSNSSSASEKVLSFLYPSRRGKRGRSLGSGSGREDDFDSAPDSAHSQSCTDDEQLEEVTGTPRVAKLSPIASGTSLTTTDRTTSSEDHKGTFIKDKTPPTYSDKRTFPTLTPPHHLPSSNYGFRKLRALGIQRRGVSESSHDESQTKISLKHSISSSYDHSLQVLQRSPSGCSELSSVRSTGVLATRWGSSSWLSGTTKGRDGDHSLWHVTGPCYMGFAVPLDLDNLLLDSSVGNVASECRDKSYEDKYAPPSETVWSALTTEIKGHKKLSKEKSFTLSVDENAAFESHEKMSCLKCYSFAKKSGVNSEGKEMTESIAEPTSPLSNNSDITNSVNMADDSGLPSSRTNNNCLETPNLPLENRYATRKEIIKFVSNLSFSLNSKSAESGLLSLKMQLPWAFQDPCLYAEICVLLSSNSFSLNARRFIQELFLDLEFKEVFEDARRKLSEDEKMYESLIKVESFIEMSDETSKNKAGEITGLIEYPEYNINDFEGFDMQEKG